MSWNQTLISSWSDSFYVKVSPGTMLHKVIFVDERSYKKNHYNLASVPLFPMPGPLINSVMLLSTPWQHAVIYILLFPFEGDTKKQNLAPGDSGMIRHYTSLKAIFSEGSFHEMFALNFHFSSSFRLYIFTPYFPV